MRVKSCETVEHYRWGGACDGWRLLSGPDLSVIEERVPAGLGEVPHVHARARQLFYVLAGRLQVDLPDAILTLAEGECLEVPPAVVHRVHNPFDREARFLVVSAPTTTGDRTNV